MDRISPSRFGAYVLDLASLRCYGLRSGRLHRHGRDIAEAAALCLLRREQAAGPLPREAIELVGPDILTGEAAAAIWTKVLNKPVRYGGDDLAAFEHQFRAFAPGWMAYDLRLMFGRQQRDGMIAAQSDIDRLTRLLGHPLRSYHDFAVETVEQWQAG